MFCTHHAYGIFQCLYVSNFLSFVRCFDIFAYDSPLPYTVISQRKREEVVFDDTTDIQVVVQTFQAVIMKQFVFSVSHCFSVSILPNTIWFSRDCLTRGRSYSLPTMLVILDNISHRKSREKRHFGPFQEGGVYIPNLKDWVLTPKVDKIFCRQP